MNNQELYKVYIEFMFAHVCACIKINILDNNNDTDLVRL